MLSDAKHAARVVLVDDHDAKNFALGKVLREGLVDGLVV